MGWVTIDNNKFIGIVLSVQSGMAPHLLVGFYGLDLVAMPLLVKAAMTLDHRGSHPVRESLSR
jgi:hypothetical protein